jgi:PadR family transcriptional regulator PadR
MSVPIAPSSLISGHIDIILLKIISLEDGYGYSISKTIAAITENACEIKEATLYAGLRRLEAEKLIASYWGDESQGGRRKYYTLTQAGAESLQENIIKWEMTKTLLDKILNRRDSHARTTDARQAYN